MSTKSRPKKKYKTNRKDLDGSGFDLHKAIGKLPRPQSGFTPGKYKYMGPYNPLHEQLEYDKNKKPKKPSSEKNWQEKLANELHKPIKRKFTLRRVIVNHINEIWAADLVEMQQFSKWNKGYKYLLMVIDVFSKYGWIVPLKNKGETEKHFKAFHLNIYGLIEEVSFITNM